MHSRKRKSTVENFLHFEESVRDFPFEFQLMFGGGFSKELYDKANSKRLMILEKHFSSSNTIGKSSMTQHNDNTEEEMKTETQLLRTNNGNQPNG